MVFQSKKLKADVGEELYGIATRIRQLLLEAKKLGQKRAQEEDEPGPSSFHYEFLQTYQEIRNL